MPDGAALVVSCLTTPDGSEVSFDGDDIIATVWISSDRISEEGAMIEVQVSHRLFPNRARKARVGMWRRLFMRFRSP
ncbi:hypothetical protein [Micromonospora sp. NPDC048830]|uniref:hypothetical protein n=1 Tax=Micromonospora sp. NPDC048830 TaxID=3364257 RepID=UPI00371862F8